MRHTTRRPECFSAEEAAELEIRSTLLSGLGKWLAHARMTQTEAARVLNVKQARVSDIKRGKINQFSRDVQEAGYRRRHAAMKP